MMRRASWCISKQSILKWLQIIVCIVLAVFLLDGRVQWHFYTFAYVTAILLMICSFLLLLAIFFELPATNKIWLCVEIGFDLVACLVCLIMTAVLIYDFVLMTSGRFGHHRYMPPVSVGRAGWKNRIVICSVFYAFNTAFYLLSLLVTSREGIE
uniref:MARVEL domain-containing protein n=1 Tax=Parascaris univalens TaxID=6257 RepID=A0A915C4J5_PARUN